MADPDFDWFDRVVAATRLVPDPLGGQTRERGIDQRVARGVSAGQRWTVIARCTTDTESGREHSVEFTAPSALAPPFDQSDANAGRSPVGLRVRRDDQVKANFGGDLALGAIVTVFAAFRRSRRDKVLTPLDRLHIEVNPTDLIPRHLIDRLATWPGDAAFGLPTDQPPPSGTLARTPDGGLTVLVEMSPWKPLTMRTNAFGNVAQFEHAVATWQMLLDHLAAQSGAGR